VQHQPEASNCDSGKGSDKRHAPRARHGGNHRRCVAVFAKAIRTLRDGGIAVKALDPGVACGMSRAARAPAFEFFLPEEPFGILAHHEPSDRLFLDQVDLGAGGRHSGHRAGSTARAIAARAFIM
jgi:hypothetical protein